MRIIGVSVPVLTANIESAIARYGSLLGEEVKARFVMPGRGLTLALFGNVTLIGGAERDLARVKDLRATFRSTRSRSSRPIFDPGAQRFCSLRPPRPRARTWSSGTSRV
jgi:hypothetical protein